MPPTSLGQLLARILPQGLSALGRSEGQNIHIDWRWTSGDPKLYESYAAELIALRPDLLVVQSSPAIAALRRSTNTIPTVFVMITDPLGQGFVNNLAHPGGNMTGFTDSRRCIATPSSPVRRGIGCRRFTPMKFLQPTVN
jgi:putative ABC transport system substrate-binding protein